MGLLVHWSLFLPLGSHSPFTLLLPLIVTKGLLAITSCHVGPLGFYLFSWIFIAHLLYFYLLLCLWVYWLLLPTMLANWVFTSCLGLS